MFYLRKSFDPNLSQEKVRDHDHLSGKFRGAAHSLCNLQFQQSQKIRVFSIIFVVMIPILLHYPWMSFPIEN